MNTLDLTPTHLLAPLANSLNDLLPRIPNAVVTLVVGLLVIRILGLISSWLVGFIRMPAGLKGIIISLINTILGIFLVIVVLQSLGLNNLAFAFSAAVAAVGLALGNGSATSVQDVLAGIFLARDRDFNIGDLVRISENPGGNFIEGIIEGMDMRRTRIRDPKGQLHVFPNSYIERREWILVTKKRDLKA